MFSKNLYLFSYACVSFLFLFHLLTQGLILSLLVFERRQENREYTTEKIFMHKNAGSLPRYLEQTALMCGPAPRDRLRTEYRASGLLRVEHASAQVPERFAVTMSAPPRKPTVNDGPAQVTAQRDGDILRLSCSCLQDRRWGLPCRHIIAVFKYHLDQRSIDPAGAAASVAAAVHPRWLRQEDALCGMAAHALALAIAEVESAVQNESIATTFNDDLACAQRRAAFDTPNAYTVAMDYDEICDLPRGANQAERYDFLNAACRRFQDA